MDRSGHNSIDVRASLVRICHYVLVVVVNSEEQKKNKTSMRQEHRVTESYIDKVECGRMVLSSCLLEQESIWQ
jgi:hypothetical protein